MMTLFLQRPTALVRSCGLIAGGAVLLALAGCLGSADSMNLTTEEAAAKPVVEPGPITFVWQTPTEGEAMVIGTTTSTTSAPTAAFIARQKIHEHRHKPIVSNRIQPVIDPDHIDESLPQSGTGTQVRLVPLEGGNTIRRRANTATVVGEITVLGIKQEKIERASLTP